MIDALEIRPYREGDEKQILQLFRTSFNGRQMPLSYWRWRFHDNPSGHGIIELAWDRDLLVAHYAATTVAMSIGSQSCLTALSGTTMTHPEYRGLRLFQKLAKQAYERMGNLNITFAWGFPNAMIHRSRIRDLDWVDIYEIPMFRFCLDKKNKSSRVDNKVFEFNTIDENFDHLWSSAIKNYDIIVRRDCNYLRWRYFENPTEKYKLIGYVENAKVVGYAVYKSYQDELQIVDFLIAKKEIEICESLIEFIIQQAFEANAKSISIWMNVSHTFHHALEKIGFIPEGPITYFGGLALNSQFDASLYDFHRWYFTMSDSDVF